MASPTTTPSKAMALAGGLLALLCFGLHLVSSSAELQKFEHPRKSDGSLSLLVVGDWGRRGFYNQSRVADQMGRIGERLDIDFVISTGDNFYDTGLTGVNDRVFEKSFSNIYTAESLQKKWYSVLGNHDYHGDVLAQFDPALRKIDARWFCMRSFTVDAEIVQFFFIDTTPFVLRNWMHPGRRHYDWRGVTPRQRYLSNLLKNLDSELKASTANWKIVIGHHTLRSAGNHGDTKELVENLLPILKANGVDLYLNGHDHCLQHISSRDSPIQFITSGAGSKAWKGVYRPKNADKLEFFYDGQGFISLQLTEIELEVEFYDIFGNAIHKWSRTKELLSFM